jgi:hypothetical protein
MRRDAPVSLPADASLDRESAARWARESGMSALAARLAG